MAERSAARDIGIGVVGAGFGAAVVLLAVLLRPKRAEQAAPGPPIPAEEPPPPRRPMPPAPQAPVPPPPTAPKPSPAPTPTKDEERLTFVMAQPGPLETAGPMRFRRGEGPDMALLSLKEVVARIKAGGRFDVTLKTAGARPASADYARAYLFKSGILDVWDGEGRKWTLGPDSHLVDPASDDPDLAQYKISAGKQASRLSTATVSGNARGYYGRSAG